MNRIKRYCFGVLCLFLSICFFSCTSLKSVDANKTVVGKSINISPLTEEQQRRYDYYYLEAIRLKQLEKYDDSFQLLQHCLTINPNGAAALYEVAQYYLYLKQQALAVEALERACACAPDNFWYARALSTTHLQMNNRDKAIEVLKAMTVRFPKRIDPLYTLLDLYSRSAQYDEVIAINISLLFM